MKFDIFAQIANASNQKITQYTAIIPPQKIKKKLEKMSFSIIDTNIKTILKNYPSKSKISF